MFSNAARSPSTSDWVARGADDDFAATRRGQKSESLLVQETDCESRGSPISSLAKRIPLNPKSSILKLLRPRTALPIFGRAVDRATLILPDKLFASASRVTTGFALSFYLNGTELSLSGRRPTETEKAKSTEMTLVTIIDKITNTKNRCFAH